MKVDQLAQRLANGTAHVIDVRGHAEWEEGHVPGVENIPLGSLLDRKADLPRDLPIVLHCQGGGRSAIGAGLLLAHGFTNVSNLAGGFTEWVRRGHPVEAPTDTTV
jgi:hydroxyacylglutathione hydrolase